MGSLDHSISAATATATVAANKSITLKPHYADGYYQEGHSVDAAIHSKRSVSVIPIQEHYEEPKINSVDVAPAEIPLVLNLKSKSSPLIVNAVHLGEKHGSLKKSKSVITN